MNQMLDFTGVAYSFDSLCRPVINDLTVRFPRGWTGIVGANGSGKSTLLQIATGLLKPQAGVVRGPLPALYCAQRTDEAPPNLRQLLMSNDGGAMRLQGQLGIDGDWADRWQTLSHGQRKRAQIAAAIWCEPAVLAIDEPSNHIDAEARQLLERVLHAYRGIGLLVSHDRAMLDGLCSQCLFMTATGATLRPGGYTQGCEQAEAEQNHIEHQRELAKREVVHLCQVRTARRQRAAGETKALSKRGLSKHDSDSRARINLARVTDSKAGASLRQLDGRATQAEKRLASLHVDKKATMGFWLPQCLSKADYLFRLGGGFLPFDATSPDTGGLMMPKLMMRSDEHVAVTGPNGSGKSTLIRHVMRNMAIADERVLFIPQEITEAQSREILDRVRRTPPVELGRLMNILSRLGSEPERLLQTQLPSPGEMRKLMLANGVVRAASLIVMDEPTNHLDLPSIECLEQALRQCPCGLLLVSHDMWLLKSLTRTQWDISLTNTTKVSRLSVRLHPQFNHNVKVDLGHEMRE